jgi:hypothetical protein
MTKGCAKVTLFFEIFKKFIIKPSNLSLYGFLKQIYKENSYFRSINSRFILWIRNPLNH